MNCEHCQTLFFDYERKTLGAEAQQQLTSHLQDCAHCQAMLADLRQMNLLLDVEHAPSPQAAARFQQQLQLEKAAALSGTSKQHPAASTLWESVRQAWRRYWPSQPLAGFAYSIALLMMGFVGGQYLPARTFGFGADAGLAEQNLSRERLIQLCAVPPPQPLATIL